MRTRPTTPWNNSRYDTVIEDINGVNIEDISWTQISSISWNWVNVIDTIWQKPLTDWDWLWYDVIQPWEVDFFPWLYWVPVQTNWNRPRYWTVIEDLNWINIEDLNWVNIESVQWTDVNVIETIWN